jgi:hypothetical protein
MMGEQIVHETLDGETVVINLASGSYFSIEGTGADLWARLLAGETVTESATALAAQHGADPTAVAAAIVAFHRELFDHGIITVPSADVPTSGGDLGSFAVPNLRVYDDLREHLLLDPVHDVERGTGWPAVSP